MGEIRIPYDWNKPYNQLPPLPPSDAKIMDKVHVEIDIIRTMSSRVDKDLLQKIHSNKDVFDKVHSILSLNLSFREFIPKFFSKTISAETDLPDMENIAIHHRRFSNKNRWNESTK